MSNSATQPRILFVPPEVAFVPARMGNRIHYMGAGSRCFSGFAAELINDLLNLGVDVHVAQPDYRKLFEMISRNQDADPSIKLPIDRVHLAEDNSFFHSESKGMERRHSYILQRADFNPGCCPVIQSVCMNLGYDK